MACLYLSEQGAVVRRQGRRLLVELEGQTILEIPVHRLDRLFVFGRCQLTADAMALLLDRQIAVSLLTQRGRFRGSINPSMGSAVQLRHLQHQLADNPRFCLSFARTVTSAKILSSRAVLRRYAANHPTDTIGQKASELTYYAQAAQRASDLAQLNGFEGSAARTYFEGLALMLRNSPLPFGGRNRRPPRDPVNAMLSLGYVVLGNFLNSVLEASGFEVRLGFYHGNSRNTPALAFDLLEEFRHPVVDRFVLWLITKRILGRQSFVRSGHAVLLKKDARQRYFREWESWLNLPQRYERPEQKRTAIELVKRQVERLSRAIMNNTPYEAFVLES